MESAFLAIAIIATFAAILWIAGILANGSSLLTVYLFKVGGLHHFRIGRFGGSVYIRRV